MGLAHAWRSRGRIRALEGQLAAQAGLIRDHQSELEAQHRDADHRLKNSLQVVSSLLQLQQANVADPGLALQLREAAARVLAVARVGDALKQLQDPERADLGTVLRQFCSELQQSVAAGMPPLVTMDVDNIALPSRLVIPFTVILGELLAEALPVAAQASSDDRSVRVRLESEAGAVLLHVTRPLDSPAGNRSNPKHGSDPLGLARSFVRQAAGDWQTLRHDHALEIAVRLPLEA